MSTVVLPKPCPGCPFGYHKDAVLHLNEERLLDIATTDGNFPCHRTVEDTGGPEGGEEKVCAGWFVYQWSNQPGQFARILPRLGYVDPDQMIRDNAELVVTDLEELLQRHGC